MSDVRGSITVYARDGEGNASYDILIKSDQGIARIDFAIESGSNRSSVQFKIGEDGKSEIVIDADTVSAITRRIIAETARTVLETGILAVHGNECDIKTDTILNLLSQVALKLGAPDVQIGAGALTVTAKQQAIITGLNLIMTLVQSLDIQTPIMNLKGQVNLGKGDMRPIARLGDVVQVVGVETGGGTAMGKIISGGNNLSS